MTSIPELLETFAPIKWATPFLTSPDWCVNRRIRGAPPGTDFNADRFVRDAIRSYDGMQHWAELYQKPAPGSKLVTKSISLCKFGTGLMGMSKMCHGGAIMTMLDEALGFVMIANEAESAGQVIEEWGSGGALKKLEAGRPLEEALKGFLVTAHLDVKFLKPVFCPGVVGIEVTLLESKGHKMRFRGVMKDGEGTPLAKVEGLWVRIGGGAKM